MTEAEDMIVNDRNWKALIRPNRPVVEGGRDAARVAKLVVEPLERGFGTSLGNALRRIPRARPAAGRGVIVVMLS